MQPEAEAEHHHHKFPTFLLRRRSQSSGTGLAITSLEIFPVNASESRRPSRSPLPGRTRRSSESSESRAAGRESAPAAAGRRLGSDPRRGSSPGLHVRQVRAVAPATAHTRNRPEGLSSPPTVRFPPPGWPTGPGITLPGRQLPADPGRSRGPTRQHLNARPSRRARGTPQMYSSPPNSC